MAKRMECAAVVEFEEPLDVTQAASILSGTNIRFICLSSLSPFKMLLFFENEMTLKSAIVESSPLRALFTDVRRWSEDERYDERLTWVECVGLHPKCWSFENFMKIGERWGKTLKINDVDNGVNSLTTARLLVRTKAQRRIEECIRLEWQSGSCDVWITEIGRCDYNGENKITQNVEFHSEPSKILLTDNKENDSIQVNENTEIGNMDVMAEQNVGSEMQRRTDAGHPDSLDSPTATPKRYVSDSELEVNDTNVDLGVPQHIGGSYQATNDHDPLVCTLMNREDGTPPAAILELGSLDEFQPRFNAIQQASISVPLQPAPINIEVPCNNGVLTNINGSALSTKRPRGRPKKLVLQQPSTACVELHSSSNALEAQRTWAVAKQLGVSSSNEEDVLTELQKSKRLLLLGADAN
ncbi:unnamed protein product [Amaranthus hypochondriacus]